MSAEVLSTHPETASQLERLVEPSRLKGPMLDENGCHFGITVGQNAEAVTLYIHDPDNPKVIIGSTVLTVEHPSQDVAETRQHFTTYIKGLEKGALYTYRISGRNIFDEHEPNREVPPFDIYNARNQLLDPYARAVHHEDGEFYGVVTDDTFDWQGDVHPEHQDKIICELQVKGSTQLLDSIPEELRGTYAGFASDEFIAHLKEVGYTHVELLPIFQFAPTKEIKGQIVPNYWGYDPINFMSPHQSYSSDKTPGGQVDEFKNMVKKLHEHGIGVILDVVYNHTGEGGIGGKPISFKGVDNDGYYMYDRNSNPIDTNGCGTNFDASTEAGREIILDSLRYWAQEMHVDGFRFDLAPVLARKRHEDPGYIDTAHFGQIPIIEAINGDKTLKSTMLIAEPWDIRGHIDGSIGHFAGSVRDEKGNSTNRWQEWNGFYRDELRDIIRGRGTIQRLSNLVLGRDLAQGSVHFITAHDGFTGYDLVSYNEKHNDANGEKNRDGSDNNMSYNHGVEGPTDDATIIENRLKALRNGLSILFASNGAVMMAAGDELLRTQDGNNNAYCQDNKISWYPWDDLTDQRIKHKRFVSADVWFRRTQPQFAPQNTPTTRYTAATAGRPGDFEWINEYGEPMVDERMWRENKVLGLFRSGDRWGRQVDDVLTFHNIGHTAVEVAMPRDRRFVGPYSKVIDSAAGVGYSDHTQEPAMKDKFLLDPLSTIKLRRRNK